jgi:glycosyltransferase involved in cell wall biosynthesis
MMNTNNHDSIIKVLMFGTGLDVKGGVTSVEKLIINNAPSQLRINHVATIGQGSVFYNIILFAKAIRSLILTIVRKDVDIIHIHFSERGSTLRKSILILIGLIFRQSIILHAHGATYKEFYEGLPVVIKKILVALISRCKVIALSESWQDYYSSSFSLSKSEISVLYNPVDMPVNMPYRQGRKQLKFIFLGRIGKRGGALDIAKSLMSFPKQDKGAFDLIHAFSALSDADRHDLELVMAGNGDLDAASQLINDLNLADKITILDWLNSEQRDKLLASADAFILPSYNEGLPMSMLESMAWGLPVIVTPVGGIPEVIIDHQNGLLVEPGVQEQLVTAMQSLIRDESLRLSLGAAGRGSIKGLNIHNYMDSLLTLYTSAIKKK